jgi:ABC-type uncharacterized transport system permease subunit
MLTDVISRCAESPVLPPPFRPLSYFVAPDLALALGEGDAAGEGLATGLAVFTGAVVVGAVGEADVDGAGLAVVGVFALFSGSVAQPAAKAIESVATINSAARLIKFRFEDFISLTSLEQD